nr:uncharacterized protein LOC118969168 [Manis javanica]
MGACGRSWATWSPPAHTPPPGLLRCCLRLFSRARPVTDQQQLRSARSAPNPRAQVDSAGPRPALSAGPTPPRPPGRSPVPATGAGRERVQNHCHPGRLPPKHSQTPDQGPELPGGHRRRPGTNPPVGGGVPPCGLVVSEQNADRKCSCRNDSLRRRQTLTTTPSSPLHFRHRRRRRHFGSSPPRGRAAPHLAAPGVGPRPAARRRRLFSAPFTSSGQLWMLPFVVDLAEQRVRCGTGGPALPALYQEAGRNGARVRWWWCAWGTSRHGSARRLRSLPQLVVVTFREPRAGRPRRGRLRYDSDNAGF